MTRILYICTHNRCRSILSEAVTRHAAADTLDARSAGSQPVGQVHPLSIRYLSEKGIDVSRLESQSWDEFEEWAPDIVVTVCDSAAAETCPVWFGDTIKIHWGLKDPSKLEGTDAEIRAAFLECIAIIESRVKAIAEAVQSSSTNDELAKKLNALTQT